MSAPRLAAKARLKWDKREGRWLLVYPERGILLNEAGGAILSRCDGAKTVETIVDELVTASDGSSDAATIDADVRAFLEEMRKRGVVEL